MPLRNWLIVVLSNNRKIQAINTGGFIERQFKSYYHKPITQRCSLLNCYKNTSTKDLNNENRLFFNQKITWIFYIPLSYMCTTLEFEGEQMFNIMVLFLQ